jgi:protein tyrosine phosphatase (PTP) superfamily phosphohydrolase (DUF442 family)
VSADAIFNFVRLGDRVATAGQPTAEQLQAVRDEGFDAVVNLAPHDHAKALPDERGLVESLGMTYHHIPVSWKQPTRADFAAFVETMDALGAAKVLVHCAANLRVSAFYSTYALKREGWTRAQADALIERLWGQYPQYRDDPVWKAFVAQIRES